MRAFRFLLPAFFVFAGFSGCTDQDPEPKPEPAQPKTFTGCRLIKTVDPNTGGGTEYFYDSRNNIVRENSFGVNGPTANYTTYDYDANGRIVSSKHYESGRPATDYLLREFTYNNAGMLILEKTYSVAPNQVFGGDAKYLYDANGRVDSVWTSGNPALPSYGKTLDTYEYDAKGNLLKRNFFPVQPNGSIKNYPDNITVFSNYDAFKYPYTQPNFTLRQLNPIFFFTKNNPGNYEHSGNRITYQYTYRPDSLISEERHGNYTTQFIYDCN